MSGLGRSVQGGFGGRLEVRLYDRLYGQLWGRFRDRLWGQLGRRLAEHLAGSRVGPLWVRP